METSRHRFTTQEKLTILSEADKLGTANVLSKYNLSSSVFSRWQKDLNKSKTRQVAIKKEEDAQTIESLKAEIERLKEAIADQTTPVQKKEQKLELDKPTANKKAQELYSLVASLIVDIVLREFDEEFENEDMHGGESKDKG